MAKSYLFPLVTMMTYIISTQAALSTPFDRGTNRLFLDTADQSTWNEILPIGIFHGITTNPTLLQRANEKCSISNVHRMALNALSIPGCKEFMCQTWGSNAKEMYDNGMLLSEKDRERIVIKAPVTLEGTKAASKLIQSGVRVCLTACYNSQQAIIAAGLGADYLAPYLGRMTDSGKDGMAECRRMEEIVRGMGSKTRILVASIRDVESMAELMRSGMDTFTFNPDVARALFNERLTDEAAKAFEDAAGWGSM